MHSQTIHKENFSLENFMISLIKKRSSQKEGKRSSTLTGIEQESRVQIDTRTEHSS